MTSTVLKQLEELMAQLEAYSSEYAAKAIPEEYQKALDEIYEYFQSNHLLMKPPQAFAQLHADTIYGVAREMQYLIKDGIASAGRQILRYVDDARDEALRAAGLAATGEKLASGSTVRQMKDNLVKKLQEQGFMTVQYGEGSKAYQVPLDTYAKMVARSTTREAGNLARETQLTENGYDLVKMSEHFPTCERCAPLQGRVYSISGTDKRFPPLSKAFPSLYRNVHPNCRHIVSPYVETLQTDEEIQKDIEQSNKPFEDPRSDEEKNLYNQEQKNGRQMRQDRYQYERYKARLGDDAPKSFHAFRKMKKTNGERWQALNDQYNLKSLTPYGKIKKKIRSFSTATETKLAFVSNHGPRYIPKGSELLSVNIIAAPELSVSFHNAQDRARAYGGKVNNWIKKAGKVESDLFVFDIHWEENIEVGRINWKIKRITEKR